MTRMHVWFVGLALAGCATDPTTTCPTSLATFCATTSLPCPMTWTAAQDPASWGGCSTRDPNTDPLIVKDCANVKIVEMWGVDASTNYTYDASTGELLSVTGHQANRPSYDSCVAGVLPNETCDDPAPRDLCQ